jgi:hypothetical protein
LFVAHATSPFISSCRRPQLNKGIFDWLLLPDFYA